MQIQQQNGSVQILKDRNPTGCGSQLIFFITLVFPMRRSAVITKLAAQRFPIIPDQLLTTTTAVMSIDRQGLLS